VRAVSVPRMADRHDAALIFDLDGTLADTVYQHVMAWDTSLRTNGIDLSVWRIHRRIGMSGGLFVRALRRELGRDITPALIDTLQRAHAEAYAQLVDQVRPLPGARELLATLTAEGVPWAIATSGSREVASRTLRIFALPDDVPIVTRTDVAHAKPNPDLFLEAARRLNIEPRFAFVVGDSIWDLLAAQRAGSLGIGVLSGGYGDEELQRAGAYRVYADPADLLLHLDELGIRVSERTRFPVS
jgi:HAD superfamily hydrolase (TIGR01509 family)